MKQELGINMGVFTTRLSRPFVICVGGFLCLTGMAKMYSVLGETGVLGKTDRLFWFLTNRQLFFIAASLELFVAWHAIFRTSAIATLHFSGGLASLFLAYRVALYLIGSNAPCNCLGVALAWLPISLSTVDMVLCIALIIILIGSYALLFFKLGETE